jgi:flagellar basal body-associated protein FliL
MFYINMLKGMSSMKSRTRSSAESLIVTLMLIVIALGGLGYCFSLSSAKQSDAGFLQTVRGLYNVVTCKHDLDPPELNVEDLSEELAETQGLERMKIIKQLGTGASSHWANHATPALIEVLKSRSNTCDERAEAAQSLVHLGAHAREAIPLMFKCLDDENGEVRQLAVCFITGQGRLMKQPLLQELQSSNDLRFASAAMALSQYPTVSLQPFAGRLEALSQHQDVVIRSQVARALGQVKTNIAQQRLQKLLVDQEPQVRLEAVLSLGITKPAAGQQMIAMLKPALKDQDAAVRHSVVRILSQYSEPQVEKVVETMIHHESDVTVKQSMVRALDRMGIQRSRATH